MCVWFDIVPIPPKQFRRPLATSDLLAMDPNTYTYATYARAMDINQNDHQAKGKGQQANISGGNKKEKKRRGKLVEWREQK